MPQPYLEDVRERAVGAVEAGVPRANVVQLFAVSLASLKRWLLKRREGQSLTPQACRRRSPGQLGRPEALANLRAQLEAYPDERLVDHCRRWKEATGRSVSVATMHRAWRALNWTHQKSGSRPASAMRVNAPRGAKRMPA
jgi:transposase